MAIAGVYIAVICRPTKAEGLAQAFIIGAKFVQGGPSALVLGDNIFYGHGLADLRAKCGRTDRRHDDIRLYVSGPERYGVVGFDENGEAMSIEEEPLQPKSNFAVTGLYFYDQQVLDIAANIRPSGRGELEITDLNRVYLERAQLAADLMGRGFAWLVRPTALAFWRPSIRRNTGTAEGFRISCPEEVTFNQGFIDRDQLELLA